MPNYPNNPVIQTVDRPLCRISDEYGDPLTHEELQDIAEFFAFADRTLLSELDWSYTAAQIDTDLNPSVVDQATRQFRDIQTRKRRFCTAYLSDTALLPFWVHLKNIYLSRLSVVDRTDLSTDPHSDSSTIYLLRAIDGILERIFERIEKRAKGIPERLAIAAGKGYLQDNDRAGIRLRWLELDNLFNIYNENAPVSRNWPNWPTVRAQVDAAHDKASKRKSDTFSGQNSQSTPHHSFTVIYWITITAAIFISFPTLFQAYRYSSHKPGTTTDADFWLLLQTGGMQALNLATTGYAIHKDYALSRFNHRFLLVVIGLGLLFVAAAAALYVNVPTEWSALVSSFAGFVQAFVLVQVLFEKKEKRD